MDDKKKSEPFGNWPYKDGKDESKKTKEWIKENVKSGEFKSQKAKDVNISDGIHRKDGTVPEEEQYTYQCKPVTKEEIEYLRKNKIISWDMSLDSVRRTQEDICLDTGNSLLNDLDKLWEMIGKVFKEYRTIDSECVLTCIKKHLGARTVDWDNAKSTLVSTTNYGKWLRVDGAKTNINYSQAKKAIEGLREIVSPTAANKVVGRLIANKLKKVF